MQWPPELVAELFAALRAALRPDGPIGFDGFVSAEPVKRALAEFSARHPHITPAFAKRRLQDALRSAAVREKATRAWCLPSAVVPPAGRKDHAWADLSNQELWDALSGARASRTFSELAEAAASERERLSARFSGLGRFEQLAALQADGAGFALSIPAPRDAPTPPSVKLCTDTSEVVVWSAETGIAAFVHVPLGSLVSRASFSVEPEGPFCLWKVRVELATQMPVQLVLMN